MSSSELDAVVAELWAGFVPLALRRVQAVEAYAAALSSGAQDPELRAAAATAAHKLAGALGTYGRPGSEQAARLEGLLAEGAPAPAAAQVQELAAVLRRAVVP